jgi:flagellar assembly protein FliH
LSSAPATENDFAAHVFPRADERAPGRQSGDNRAALERQWRARGHAAGYTEGNRAAAVEAQAQSARLTLEHGTLMQAARLQHERALAALHAAARALDSRTVPVLQDAEDSVLSAAMELAEAIVGHTLADEARAARFALGRASSGNLPGVAGTHTVRLHPQDLALLNPADLAGTGVTFVPDTALARGDAVSEFPHGFLDARIGSALERAKAALLAPSS